MVRGQLAAGGEWSEALLVQPDGPICTLQGMHRRTFISLWYEFCFGSKKTPRFFCIGKYLVKDFQ